MQRKMEEMMTLLVTARGGLNETQQSNGGEGRGRGRDKQGLLFSSFPFLLASFPSNSFFLLEAAVAGGRRGGRGGRWCNGAAGDDIGAGQRRGRGAACGGLG